MSALTLNAAYPGFDNLKSHEADDSPEGAAQAFERLSQSYTEQWAAGELDDQQADAVAASAGTLVHDLDQALQTHIEQIMPPENTTKSPDYVFEDSEGQSVSVMGITNALRGAVPEPEEPGFRVANSTLEQSFQALLDHLTAARIAEEMDAPTYLEMLRGAFRRVRDGSRNQGDDLAEYHLLATRFSTRLSVVDRILEFLRLEVLPRIAGRPDHSELKSAVGALEAFNKRTKALAAHYENFLKLSNTSLTRAKDEFASDKNMAGVEGESLRVSREIESLAFFRPLPLLWAVSITFAVKIVLAHNTSEVLHAFTVPILVLSFLITWVLSIYIGVAARRRRMSDLRNHTKAQLRSVLMIPATRRTSVLRGGGIDDDLIEFPPIPSSFTEPVRHPVTAFSSTGKAVQSKLNVVRLNLFALLIPLVLLVVVTISRHDGGHEFVARFEGAEPCILASGQLTAVTRRAYYVLPDGRTNTPFQNALSRVFPEFLADVIDRHTIIRVRERDDPDRPQLVSCEAQRIAVAGTTIINGGINEGGNATSFASDTTIQTLNLQLEAIATALGAPRPIEIDLDQVLQNEDGSVAVTVNLGNTSLDILSQAIVNGGTGFLPPVLDPVILQARADIKLALSTNLPDQIDFSSIVAALSLIREQLGEDITMEQALNVVFGGPQITSQITLTDEFRAFFAQELGGEKLVEELGALRLALENSNALAARLMAVLELEGDGDTAVTMINDNLTVIMDRQDRLIAAITSFFDGAPEGGLNTILERQDRLVTALTTVLGGGSGSTLVVTPAIIGPSGSGPGLVVPDPGTITGAAAPGVFQTMIMMGNKGGTAPEPVSVANTLVLPFWSMPVSTDQNNLNTPDNVWNWAIDLANMIDPVVTDDDQTYFGRIAGTLRACLAENATLELDILGLASRSWDGPVDQYSASELNFYLAEGRRIAALRQLRDSLGDPAVESRILVRLADGSTRSMQQIISDAVDALDIQTDLPSFSRFGASSQFETRRDTLLNVTGLNAADATPLEELFGRSVVLRMISAGDGPCAF